MGIVNKVRADDDWEWGFGQHLLSPTQALDRDTFADKMTIQAGDQHGHVDGIGDRNLRTAHGSSNTRAA